MQPKVCVSVCDFYSQYISFSLSVSLSPALTLFSYYSTRMNVRTRVIIVLHPLNLKAYYISCICIDVFHYYSYESTKIYFRVYSFVSFIMVLLLTVQFYFSSYVFFVYYKKFKICQLMTIKLIENGFNG